MFFCLFCWFGCLFALTCFCFCSFFFFFFFWGCVRAQHDKNAWWNNKHRGAAVQALEQRLDQAVARALEVEKELGAAKRELAQRQEDAIAQMAKHQQVEERHREELQQARDRIALLEEAVGRAGATTEALEQVGRARRACAARLCSCSCSYPRQLQR